MTSHSTDVIGGIDTHKHTHHAAVVDAAGRLLGHAGFPASPAGHAALLGWLREHGQLQAVGVEGTGSYGAGLTRYLLGHRVKVVEVNRQNRQDRRARGKTDALDAERAARAVLAQTARATPKAKTGPVEGIRMLRVVRATAVKSRTQAINALHGLLVTAPDQLRVDLAGLRGPRLVQRCIHLQPEPARLVTLLDRPDALVLAAATTAVRELALRWQHLNDQVKALDVQLAQLLPRTAPGLLALPGVGPTVAGQLLVTAGDNPDRLTSEAAFARLCGVAPQPASSGRSTRHRLSRSGDRAANNALHMVVITRMRQEPRTLAYVQRRTTEGRTKREIIRCLKRYLAREVFAALQTQPPVDPT
jgi:transposase